MTIRVILPQHLRTLAHVGVEVESTSKVQSRSARSSTRLKTGYPMLRGTIRDQVTQQRRPFLRFFACEEDLSHESPDAPLPEAVASGAEPLLIIGADCRRLGAGFAKAGKTSSRRVPYSFVYSVESMMEECPVKRWIVCALLALVSYQVSFRPTIISEHKTQPIHTSQLWIVWNRLPLCHCRNGGFMRTWPIPRIRL